MKPRRRTKKQKFKVFLFVKAAWIADADAAAVVVGGGGGVARAGLYEQRADDDESAQNLRLTSSSSSRPPNTYSIVPIWLDLGKAKSIA